MSVGLALIWWLKKILKKGILMAFKGQKKSLKVGDDTNFPNSFNDFHLIIASTAFSQRNAIETAILNT